MHFHLLKDCARARGWIIKFVITSVVLRLGGKPVVDLCFSHFILSLIHYQFPTRKTSSRWTKNLFDTMIRTNLGNYLKWKLMTNGSQGSSQINIWMGFKQKHQNNRFWYITLILKKFEKQLWYRTRVLRECKNL